MAERTSPTARDPQLDALKGLLVLAMLLYHAMNYFSTAGEGAYAALRFVNGGFIFLAGFVAVMAARRDAARLFWRGARLMLLFAALNIAINAAGLASYRHAGFELAGLLRDAPNAVFSGTSEHIAFRILAPIAWTLMLAPLALIARPVPLLWGAAVVLVAAALYTAVLPLRPTPYFVLLGACGVVFGRAAGWLTVDRPPALRVGLGGIVVLALGIAAMDRLSGNVLAYAVGLAVVLRLLYRLLGSLPRDGFALRSMSLLGRYSLVSYIGQILLLFGLHRWLGGARWPPGLELLLICLGSAVLLWLMCVVLARLRAMSRWVDRGYRAVFA